MARMLVRIGRWSARRRRVVVVLWAAALVGLLSAGSVLGGEFTDDFSVPGAESQKAADLLTEHFPEMSGGGALVVFRARSGRVTEGEAARAIARTVERIESLPHVVAVAGPRAESGAGQMSPDGTIAFASVTYDRSAIEMGKTGLEDLSDAAFPARSNNLQIEVGGELATAANDPEPGAAEQTGLLVAVVVLFVAFGSLVAVSLPIAIALAGIGVGLAAVLVLAAFAPIPTVSLTIALMVGLGVGIDYALFVVTRYRQNLQSGLEPLDAIGVAAGSAGHAVVVAGVTVMVAITGLWLSGLPIVGWMGTATAVVVAVAVLATIILLPALLGFVGAAIDKVHVPAFSANARRAARAPMWQRWGREVADHPWRYLIGAVAVLVALAAPLVSLRLGMVDDGTAPPSESRRRAYDLLTRGFGPGFNGPLLLAVELGGEATQADAAALAETVAADEGIAQATPPIFNAEADTAVITAIPKTAPRTEATAETIERLSREVLPEATASGVEVHVGGLTATFDELAKRVAGRLPLFIGAVVGLSLVLLTIMFRSILVPLKAALMNLLSIGAAYGVVVAIFQWGWAKDLFGLEDTVPIISFVPLIMFAILFGLSMDYEVFLLSRIREAHLAGQGTVDSVVTGISATARVITAAALVMISVFVGFAGDPDPTVKMIGIGLATAVLVDATIIRIVLVPATMALLGEANWWLPRWLDRILPRIDFEGRAPGSAAERPREAA